MHQSQLLPASYDEVIEEKHVVRVVNEAIEKIDLGSLVAQYQGGGTSDNGYETPRRNYECLDGQDCPLKPHCTQAQGNRKIRISFRLLEYRRQARANLTSEEGQRLRAARSTDMETGFGHLKHNMGFRRFHLWGLQKVKTEWGILSIAHNMQKLAAH